MPRYIDADKLIELATHEGAYGYVDVHDIYSIPPADVVEVVEEKEIGYHECSDALLKMWMDNVLTDKEYNRIMNKLNMKWKGENR